MRHWPGFSTEFVQINGLEPYEYRSRGDHHYLAIHDIVLKDSELLIDGMEKRQDLDLRNKVTFVPKGCGVEGWSEPARRSNSFFAVYYDTNTLHEDLDLRYNSSEPAPFAHVRSAPLQSTLLKLESLMRQEDQADDLLAESLCLLSAVEVFGVLADPGGRLSDRQVSMVRDYVDAHLHDDISLADLANVANLSRFHFSRAFKAATGETPTSFVQKRRIERSKALLDAGGLPIELVALAVGFKGAAQFRRVFREIVGVPPAKFRSQRF